LGSKLFKLKLEPFRGGIAVVWLGKVNDKLVAMKQFPVKANKQVDSSA
jgi:hypothetical protein